MKIQGKKENSKNFETISNIEDNKYLEQLNGYKEYIKTISSKPIYTYLYSIIGEKIEEL